MEYINLIISCEFSLSVIATNNNLSPGMLSAWINKYNDKGNNGLVIKPISS